MKVKVRFLDNGEDIDKAKEMGVDIEPKYVLNEFHFDKALVSAAHLVGNKEYIAIYVPSGRWDLGYSDELWEEIKKCIAENEKIEPTKQ